MTVNDPNDTSDFDEFVASGEVEVGDTNLASQDEKPAETKEAPAPETEIEEIESAEDSGEESENEDDGKPKKSPRDHQIERLKREKAELARQLREKENTDLSRRLENLEKSLQTGNTGGNSDTGPVEPDATDFDKYPLGHLDDRYIEDKLDWLAEKKAAERAEAVLRRQQENEQTEAVEREQQQLLEKVDTLANRGSDIYDDFQETVVEAGMRGDWDLSQTTFEAAHEADNGVQILYELAQNKAEATRVAKMTPFQQLRYVEQRDREISEGKSPRRIPKAGEPPKNTARGANSRTSISPATDNLDDFEKLWEQDAKRSLG